MKVTNSVKFFVLRHYLWIACVLLVGSAISLMTFPGDWKAEHLFTLVGIPFSFAFLMQKEKLEETRLFKELFQEFNARYDRLNADLNRIRDESIPGLSPRDRDVVYDYFNLCAEEHYFYRLGYIPEDVWTSWSCGMKYFLDCERIRKAWDDDQAGSSYYGLTFPPPKPPPFSEPVPFRPAA